MPAYVIITNGLMMLRRLLLYLGPVGGGCGETALVIERWA